MVTKVRIEASADTMEDVKTSLKHTQFKLEEFFVGLGARHFNAVEFYEHNFKSGVAAYRDQKKREAGTYVQKEGATPGMVWRGRLILEVFPSP